MHGLGWTTAQLRDKGCNPSEYAVLARERIMHPGPARLVTICLLSLYTSVLALSSVTLQKTDEKSAVRCFLDEDGESPQSGLLYRLSKRVGAMRRGLGNG